MCVVVVVSCVLVVFPVVGSYATEVYRGPLGYEWYSKKGNNYQSAYTRLDIDHTVLLKYPDGRKKIQYSLKWNKNKDQAAMSGRSWLFVYLPIGLHDGTIRITREKDELTLGMKKEWKRRVVASNQTIGEFHEGNTRDSHIYPEQSFLDDWNKGFGETVPNKDTDTSYGGNSETTCDMVSWKDSGRFGRSLWSWENGGLTTHYWTVEADVSADFDPDLEPVLMGYGSTNTISFEQFYMGYGPYDTDNDGVPDVTEAKLGTNPYAGDVAFPEVKGAEYGSVLTSRPYVQHGSLQFDSNRNKWYFAQDSDAAQKVESLPPGMHFELKGQLPAGVVQVESKDNLRDGQVYLDKASGEVSFRPAPQHHGQTVEFTVGTVFQASTTCRAQLREETVASFSLVKQSDLYDPVYTDTSVQAGATKQSEAPRDKDAAKTLPAGTKFEITEEGKRAHPWATINPETGVITFTPSRHIELKDYYIPVTVTYPDTSTDTTSAKVTITKAPLQKGDFKVEVSDKEVWLQAGQPFVPKVSVKAQSQGQNNPIDLRIVCSSEKDPTNVPYGINGWGMNIQTRYGTASNRQEAAFKQTGKREPNTLYKADGILARTDSSIAGHAEKTGTYTCAFFGSSNIAQLEQVGLKSDGKVNDSSGLYEQIRTIAWDSDVITVHVVEPFALPKTGGAGVLINLGIICLSGTALTALWFVFSQRKMKKA